MQKLQAVAVTVAGARFELDPDSVEELMSNQAPEPLRDHFVVIGGRRFPPKQALDLLTGLDRSDFTTVQARSIFRRLGFSTGRSAKPSAVPAPSRKSGESGWLATEADELRPYRGRWVALQDKSVVFSADTPQEVLGWLRRHDQHASLIKVPLDPSADVGGFAF